MISATQLQSNVDVHYCFYLVIQAYDFVFDITLDDGRSVPLCYNVGDDVDFTAQQFVEKYNLPMKFLAKVGLVLLCLKGKRLRHCSFSITSPRFFCIVVLSGCLV